jgi:hypothetical protein
MNKARRGWLGKCRGLQSDQDISCQALADWMERNNKSDMMCTITKTTQQKRALFFQFVFFVGCFCTLFRPHSNGFARFFCSHFRANKKTSKKSEQNHSVQIDFARFGLLTQRFYWKC